MNRINVNVIGTRGFPNIQGGVEKHCESLYPLLALLGCEIRVFRRLPYINKENILKEFRKVRFQDIWTPKSKNLETIIHSFLAACISIYQKPDIIHIHNIGPSLVLPLFKIFDIKTVVTYHSPNYEHNKWGFFAKRILKIGEFFVRNLADQIIFVSRAREQLFNNPKSIHIPNGVVIRESTSCFDFLSKAGISPSKYILSVSRFTPEKGLDLLIKAFNNLETDYQLVIAGDADYETEYSRSIKQMIAGDKRIIHTGYITGEPLNQLFSHARLFVLPSYHEGLPIALLEAMSYGLPVLVSDIPANKEVGLQEERYFRRGDMDDLRLKLKVLAEKGISDVEKNDIHRLIDERYNWNRIAEQTIEVYKRAKRA